MAQNGSEWCTNYLCAVSQVDTSTHTHTFTHSTKLDQTCQQNLKNPENEHFGYDERMIENGYKLLKIAQNCSEWCITPLTIVQTSTHTRTRT